MRIGGGLSVVTIDSTPHNKARATLNPSGTGKNGSQIVKGDGVKNLLSLLQDSNILEEIAALDLTVDDPPGTRGPEEEGLAYVPSNGTDVEVYIGVQLVCVDPQE